MREQGIFISACIHLILLMIAYLGLPDWFQKEMKPEPFVITLENLPIKEITNVQPNNQKIVKPKPEPPAPAPKVEKQQPAPSAPKKVDPVPKPPEPVKEKEKPKPPVEKPKEKEKKPEPEPQKEEEKKDEPSLEDILEDVKQNRDKAREGDETAKKTDKAPSPKENKTFAPDVPYDPTIPISVSEKMAVVNQIVRHWSPPAGVKDDYSLNVSLDVKLRQDGSVISVGFMPETAARMRSNPAMTAAAQSARRAVLKASPLKNLPQNKYNSWKEMTLNFNPQMLY